jgi:cytochrome c biogenesis protein
MTAISNKRGSGVRPGQSKAGKFRAFLGSVRLALFLLSFIAVVSIFGTLIKQQAPPEEYLSRFSTSAYAIIHGLGFDDVFHSWWFFLSVLIFALNLTLCTFDRLVFLLKGRASETLPKESSLSALDLGFFQPGVSVEEIAHLLRGYRTTSVTQQGAILERGKVAQYGVLVIHGSILLVLLGSLIGLRFGYKGSLALSVGESKDAITSGDSGAVHRPLGFTVKCVDFRVDFYENGQPKEFVSSLEASEDNRIVAKKDIRVNDPLTYKGISFYQATYGDNAVFRFSIDGKSVELNEGGAFQSGGLSLMVVQYAESVHDFGPGVQMAYLDNGEPKAVWFLRDVPRLREQAILGIPVKLQEIKQQRYTGLEVTKDPGLWFVWSGFFFMLCGLYINFGLYHRRLYLLSKDGGVLIAGTSRKNREGLKREIQRLKERLNAQR